MNCNQNMEKCGMAEFSQMMIKFCPATCGLCLAKRCRDQIEDCEAMKSLCINELYATFMEHQCARTCGKCKTDEGGDDIDDSQEQKSGGKKSDEQNSGEDGGEEDEKPIRRGGGRPKHGGGEATGAGESTIR